MRRNNKFWGIKATPELKEMHSKTIRVINDISSEIRKLIIEGKIKEMRRHEVVLSPQFLLQLYPHPGKTKEEIDRRSRNAISDSELKDFMEPIFKKAGAVGGIENYKRSLVKYLMERFLGYHKRNKSKKVPNIRIHDEKTLYFKDNSAKFGSEGIIILTTLFGKVEIKYAKRFKESAEIPFVRIAPKQIQTDTRAVKEKMVAKIGLETFKIKKVNKDILTLDRDPASAGFLKIEKTTFGGNLTFHPKTNSYCMVALVDHFVDPKYAPTGTLSFDMNKTPEHWLTFNDGSVIPMEQELKDLSETIRNTNKLLALKNKPVPERFYIDEQTGKKLAMRSKNRRNLRKFWKGSHRKLKKLCQDVARQIADKATAGNYLLAIDSVKGGDKTGTYGQDHIIPELQRICENEGIPFYVVPCKNTSRRCSECGYTNKENRKSTDDFLCLKCGHAELSHMNAAKNIASRADQYLEKGEPYGNYSKRF